MRKSNSSRPASRSLHEAQLDLEGKRKAQGSFYTPPEFASSLVGLALDRLEMGVSFDPLQFRVLDPACGNGVFLVEVVKALLERFEASPEVSVDEIVSNCIFGTDIDEVAVQQCRASLMSLGCRESTWEKLAAHVVVADGLLLCDKIVAPQLDLFGESEPNWSSMFPEVFENDPGFDLVVGNPPFLNQLETQTSRSVDYQAQMMERFGGNVRHLTNPSSLFLLAARKVASQSKSVVAMIQPLSFLAVRDSVVVRKELAEAGEVSDLWICREKVFDASVQVVSVVLRSWQERSSIEIWSGPTRRRKGEISTESLLSETWSAALCTEIGFPRITFQSKGQISDLASVTADFRDQYYGVSTAVVELEQSEESPCLITTAHINFASCEWGEREVRFNKQVFRFPRIQLDSLDEKMSAWAQSRLVPKVLLATQTKVLEVVVDERGVLLPSVPVLSILSNTENVWRVGAILSSPVLSLIAAQRHLGAGMSSEVLKLGAKDVANLPLPVDLEAWDEASCLFKSLYGRTANDRDSALLLRFAEATLDAFQVKERREILDWWISRLPRNRGKT